MNKELKEKWDKLLDGLDYEKKDKVLTEEEISTFENNNGITLPEDYRYFLKHVGNGIIIKNGASFKMELGYLERPIELNINNRLKLEFPFNKPYKLSYEFEEYYNQGKNFKEQDCSVAVQKLKYDDIEAQNICKTCKHLNECNDASWHVFCKPDFDGYLEEGSVPYHNGSMKILDMGFEDTYRLILTGEHQGEVWLNNWETEFIPVTKNFYDFLLAYKNKDKILTDKDGGTIWKFDD